MKEILTKSSAQMHSSHSCSRSNSAIYINAVYNELGAQCSVNVQLRTLRNLHTPN